MWMSSTATGLIPKLPFSKFAGLSTGSFGKDWLSTGEPANGTPNKLLRPILYAINTPSSSQSSNSQSTTSTIDKKWKYPTRSYSKIKL